MPEMSVELKSTFVSVMPSRDAPAMVAFVSTASWKLTPVRFA